MLRLDWPNDCTGLVTTWWQAKMKVQLGGRPKLKISSFEYGRSAQEINEKASRTE